jgi:tetratricopeptide (TPR) repeat protein
MVEARMVVSDPAADSAPMGKRRAAVPFGKKPMPSCHIARIVWGSVVALLLAGCSGYQPFFSTRPNADTHLQQAKALLDGGDADAALAELEQALAADPGNVAAYTAIGDIHRKKGNYPQASQNYEKACEVDPYAFRPHYNLGVTYQAMAELAQEVSQMQDYLRKAIVVYIRALAIDPGSFDTQLNLGACYYQMGQYDLAEEATRQALTLKPDNARANNNLGIILETQGRYDEAIAAYKASIEASPRQPSILLNLGSVYLHLGYLQSAMSTYRAASRMAPRSAQPWVQMGVCHFRLKQRQKAVEAFQHAIQLDPHDPSAYRGLGVICMYEYILDNSRTDLRSKALQAWKYSLDLDPNQQDLEMLFRRYTPAVPPVQRTAQPAENSQGQFGVGRVS